MPSVLPSSSAPRAQADPPNGLMRGEATAEDSGSSFGAALSRSLEPAGEATAKSNDKASPVKRQVEKPRTGMDDLVNAMAIGLVPLESRIVEAVPRSGAAGASATATTIGAASVTSAKANGPGAPTALADAAAVGLPPETIASTNGNPESGLGRQPQERDKQGAIELTSMRALSGVDLTSVQALDTAKVPADVSTPLSESVATSVAAMGTDVRLPGIGLMAPMAGGVALPDAAALEAAATATLAPEVGSSEWSKALGQQVVHMSKAGQQITELQLNPPGLGPLKVTLSMNDQQMQASFVSAHASVRMAIEAALPQLRSTLADTGISLGETWVSSESRQQQAFDDRPREPESPRSYQTSSAPDTPLITARLVGAPLSGLSAGRGIRVDTYA